MGLENADSSSTWGKWMLEDDVAQNGSTEVKTTPSPYSQKGQEAFISELIPETNPYKICEVTKAFEVAKKAQELKAMTEIKTPSPITCPEESTPEQKTSLRLDLNLIENVIREAKLTKAALQEITKISNGSSRETEEDCEKAYQILLKSKESLRDIFKKISESRKKGESFLTDISEKKEDYCMIWSRPFKSGPGIGEETPDPENFKKKKKMGDSALQAIIDLNQTELQYHLRR